MSPSGLANDFTVRENGLAAHEGVADDPGFRDELQRAADIAHEHVAAAGRKVGELEEGYDAMLREQADERERFLAQQAHSD